VAKPRPRKDESLVLANLLPEGVRPSKCEPITEEPFVLETYTQDLHGASVISSKGRGQLAVVLHPLLYCPATTASLCNGLLHLWSPDVCSTIRMGGQQTADP
jgi:hypothetical protein